MSAVITRTHPHVIDPVRACAEERDPDDRAEAALVEQATSRGEREERAADRAVEHEAIARLERVERPAVLPVEAEAEERDRREETDRDQRQHDVERGPAAGNGHDG